MAQNQLPLKIAASTAETSKEGGKIQNQTLESSKTKCTLLNIFSYSSSNQSHDKGHVWNQFENVFDGFFTSACLPDFDMSPQKRDL